MIEQNKTKIKRENRKIKDDARIFLDDLRNTKRQTNKNKQTKQKKNLTIPRCFGSGSIVVVLSPCA
jgi:hypothetical protein